MKILFKLKSEIALINYMYICFSLCGTWTCDLPPRSKYLQKVVLLQGQRAILLVSSETETAGQPCIIQTENAKDKQLLREINMSLCKMFMSSCL